MLRCKCVFFAFFVCVFNSIPLGLDELHIPLQHELKAHVFLCPPTPPISSTPPRCSADTGSGTGGGDARQRAGWCAWAAAVRLPAKKHQSVSVTLVSHLFFLFLSSPPSLQNHPPCCHLYSLFVDTKLDPPHQVSLFFLRMDCIYAYLRARKGEFPFFFPGCNQYFLCCAESLNCTAADIFKQFGERADALISQRLFSVFWWPFSLCDVLRLDTSDYSASQDNKSRVCCLLFMRKDI